MNNEIHNYIQKQKSPQKDICRRLRRLIFKTIPGVKEEMKWGQPCYTSKGRNVIIIHGFKHYCAIMYLNGALLTDKHKVLIQQTEHVQAARQIRFQNVEEIKQLETIIKEYIKEAIEVEKKGLKVETANRKDIVYPEEFVTVLKENIELKEAFEALTPGRKRAYVLHFSGAKQATTRMSRIQKYIPKILEGKGLNDY